MKKSMTVLLLSVFVYPGSGHFFLKKCIRGFLLAGLATVSLYFILVATVAMAQEISDKILSGEIPVNLVQITEAILKTVANSDIHQINMTTSLLIICWLIGMVDSYRLGLKEDGDSRAE